MSAVVQAAIPHALEHLRVLEGVRLEPYRDSGGRWTIGVGHLITDGDMRSITLGKALELLADDINPAAALVTKWHATGINLTVNQAVAIMLWIFNVGVGAASASTLAKRLLAGMPQAACAELARWNKVGRVVVPGLINRRRAEQEIFNASNLS